MTSRFLASITVQRPYAQRASRYIIEVVPIVDKVHVHGEDSNDWLYYIVYFWWQLYIINKMDPFSLLSSTYNMV